MTQKIRPDLTTTSHFQWTPPEVVVGHDVPGQTRGEDKFFEPFLAVDAANVIHLFWVCHFASRDSIRCPIQHRTLADGQWLDAASIRAYGPRVVKATAGPDGRFFLLWSGRGTVREDQRNNRLQVYFQEWSGRSWSPAEIVSDEDAAPEPVGPDQLALIAGKGQIDAFWNDVGEGYELATTDYVAKIRNRSRKEGKWTSPENLPGRGTFAVEGASIVDEGNGRLHVFWIQDHKQGRILKYSRIYHAEYVNGRLTTPELVAEPRDYDGEPSQITGMEAALTPNGGMVVAWSSYRDASPLTEEAPLQVRRQTGDGWSETVTVSRRAVYFRLVTGPRGALGMFFQPWEPNYVHFDHPIFFAPLDPTGFGEKVPVAKKAVNRVFDSTVDLNGTIHLVYNEEWSEGLFRIVHQSGRAK